MSHSFDEPGTPVSPPLRVQTTAVDLMEYVNIEDTRDILQDEIIYKCITSVPGWQELDFHQVTVKVLRGGLSNSLFTVEVNDDVVVDGRYDRKVLIRFYGTESAQFYDPEDEIATFRALSSAGAGPRLIACSPNSRIEQFLPGRTLSVPDYNRPIILGLVGAKLAKFHNSLRDDSFANAIGIPSENREQYIAEFDPFSRLTKWMKIAQDNITHAMTVGEVDWNDHISAETSEIVDKYNHPDWSDNPRILFQEVSQIGKMILKKLQPDPIRMESSEAYRLAYRKVFSHNDLHVLNMIESPHGNLSLVDVEYAMIGYAAFDFANLFVESRFDFETKSAPFFLFSHEKGICKRGKETMLAAYLNEAGLVDGWPSDELIAEFLGIVEIFEVYLYLLWGFWGLIRAPTDKAFNEGNFDFIAYSFKRFALAKELVHRLKLQSN